MSEFTLGPWAINADLPADIHDGKSGELLASTYPPDYAGGDCHANALLIAAAPEMLEALKKLVALYYCGAEDPQQEPGQFINQAKAAIRKAEGK
jgi:hypothetical protein